MKIDVLAVKVHNFLPLSLFSLAICSLLFSSPLPVKANPGDPNGADNIPKKGWTSWQRWQNIEKGLSPGVSNGEFGVWMSTVAACGTDESKLENYWFRVDAQLDKLIKLKQEGEGRMEYGCWENGRFKAKATVNGWYTPSSHTQTTAPELQQSAPLPVKADTGDPNGADNIPKKGWTLWQRWQNLEKGLSVGLSNGDYGAWQDTRVACGAATDDSKILETYWYRVDEKLDKLIKLNQEGMGTVEYGCWENGRFKAKATADGWFSPPSQTQTTAPEPQQSAPEPGQLPESTDSSAPPYQFPKSLLQTLFLFPQE